MSRKCPLGDTLPSKPSRSRSAQLRRHASSIAVSKPHLPSPLIPHPLNHLPRSKVTSENKFDFQASACLRGKAIAKAVGCVALVPQGQFRTRSMTLRSHNGGHCRLGKSRAHFLQQSAERALSHCLRSHDTGCYGTETFSYRNPQSAGWTWNLLKGPHILNNVLISHHLFKLCSPL